MKPVAADIIKTSVFELPETLSEFRRKFAWEKCKFIHQNGKEPRFCYLGRTEWQQFSDLLDPRFSRSDPTCTKSTYEGIEIIQVLGKEHFNFAL